MDTMSKHLEHLRSIFTPRGYNRKIEQPRSNIPLSIIHGFREHPIPVVPEKGYEADYRQVKKLPKIVIEPRVNIERSSDAIVVNVELPGVESEQDILLERLANSIEVRAYAGGKAYFKILKIPYRNKLIDKRLENNNLVMKFSV